MKYLILLFQTVLGVVTPNFLQGLEINLKSTGSPHGRVSSQTICSDACSWKERGVGKFQVGKFGMKLERMTL